MRALLFFAVAGLAALAPSRASAQQRPCSEGRVRTAASQGRCCWPDQSWNTTSARCEGPPSCPAGFTEEGDGCVRSSAAPAPVPAPTPAASALSAAPASFPVAIPAAPPVRVAPVVIAQGSVSPTAPPPTAPEAGIAPDGSIRYGVLPEHGATPVVARPVALAPPPVAVAPAPAPAPIAAPLPVVVAPPLVAPSPPPEPRTQPEPAPEPPPRREPYNGGPIPEGTHVESRVNVGLVVSGPLLFVAGYLYGLRGLGYLIAPGWTLVPFAGPLISMSVTRDYYDSSYASRSVSRSTLESFYARYNFDMAGFAVPSLIVQTAGFALTIAGAVVRRRELVYSPRPVGSAPRPWFERIAVVPMRSPTTSGLSVVGSF